VVLTRRLRSALLAVSVVGLLALGGAPALADDGIPIDIEVLGPSSTPSPTSSPATGGSNGGSSNGGSTTPDPAPSSSADPDDDLGDDAIDLGGVLYVGGLAGSITPNVGPTGGEAKLSITVRNTSDELTDLSLRFWVSNGFGATVGEVSGITARDLRPGETRTIRATVTAVGQWTFYTAHVKITPPKELDGVKLSPLTRDATLVVPPYFLALTGAIVGVVYFGIRFLLARRFLGVGVPA